MATGNTRDISLVIKAKNEADQAIKAVSSILEQLFGNAETASGGIADVGKALAALDKSYATIDRAANGASDAFDRQAAAIERQKVELASLQSQSEAAAASMARLKSQSDVYGPVQGGLAQTVDRLKLVTSEYNRLEGQIGKLSAAIATQDTATERSRSSLQQIGSAALGAEEAIARLTAQQALETRASLEQAAAAERVTAIQARINSNTGVTGGSGYVPLSAEAAREQLDAMKATAAAEQSMTDKAASLRAEIDPLGAVQARFNAKLGEARQLFDAGKISAVEYGAAQTLIGREAAAAAAQIERSGKSSTGGFLGLKPYELQNLSYQVNDIVTQLASGTSLTQTLGQQGGQIFQLFQGRIGPSIVGALTNPAVLAGIAGFAVLADGLKHAADQAERLRDFSAILAANADGSRYQAKALSDATVALDRYGTSAAEAKAAVTEFVREGVNPDRLIDFGRAAKDMADVMALKLPDAAKQTATAFTGGYEAIKKLDDATNVYTAAQLDHIRLLFEEGRAQDARTEAFRIFAAKMDEGATKMRGPWSDAVRSLGGAWESFTHWLGQTFIVQTMLDVVNALADGVSRLFDALSGTTNIPRIAAEIGVLQKSIAALQSDLAKAPNDNSRNRIENNLNQARAQLAAKEAELKAAEAQKAGDPKAGDNEQTQKDAHARVEALTLEAELQALRDKADKGLTATETARRIFLAGEIAANKESLGVSNQIVAAKERQLAVEKETAAARKQADTAATKAATDREKAIKAFSAAVGGAEGGTGANPKSSAVGLGQFTDSTWLGVMKQHFGADIQGLTDKQILDLRKNATLAQKAIDVFTRDNAKILEGIGAAVNEANLYLVHFLGGAGATKALKAGPNASIDKVGLSKEALAGNQQYLRTDNGKGRYRTVGELQSFLGAKVADSSNSETQGAEIIDKMVDKQAKLNEEVDAENQHRRDVVAQMTIEGRLTALALLDAQKRKAGDEAAFAVQKQYDDLVRQGIPIDEVAAAKRVQAARDTAEAEFDITHQKERQAAIEAAIQKPVDALASQRTDLQEQADNAFKGGNFAAYGNLNKQLKANEAALNAVITAAKKSWAAIGGLDADKAIAKLDKMSAGLKAAKTQFLITGDQLADMFAKGATNAFTTFAQAVAQGSNVFGALLTSFRQFAADFLLQIAQMIEQQIIFNAVSALLKGLSFGAGGAAGGVSAAAGSGANAIGSAVTMIHGGGFAGQGSLRTMNADPTWFHNAVRFHGGGIPGLKRNEVPAILEAGEEVLTRSDARHALNGGRQGAAVQKTDVHLKNVLSIDPADLIAKALSTRAGEKVFLTYLSNNASAIKNSLKG